MMLTATDDRADRPPPGGGWVTLTELARLKGVSKQAIHKRASRYQGEGLLEIRPRGREMTVNLAEWDAVTKEVTDPARLIARDTAKASAPSIAPAIEDPDAAADPSYRAQLTRKAAFEADKREIELRKMRGELLPVADVTHAAVACAERLTRDIDQLPSLAEDLATAVSRGGVAQARDLLKAKARELRETLARSMSALAAPAVGDDEDEAAA